LVIWYILAIQDRLPNTRVELENTPRKRILFLGTRSSGAEAAAARTREVSDLIGKDIYVEWLREVDLIGEGIIFENSGSVDLRKKNPALVVVLFPQMIQRPDGTRYTYIDTDRDSFLYEQLRQICIMEAVRFVYVEDALGYGDTDIDSLLRSL
jgi:hypothetical protein